MAFPSEAAVEQALLEQFGRLGYSIEREEEIGRPKRVRQDEAFLTEPVL